MIKKICLFLIFYIILVFPYQISNADIYIDANKYKQIIEDIKIKKIIQCESEGIHENTWGDNGKSYGWFQFQKESFYHISKKMGFKNAKWKDKKDQLIVAKWGIKNGYANWWSCYRFLSKKGEI